LHIISSILYFVQLAIPAYLATSAADF
jgi:hypothetical protein